MGADVMKLLLNLPILIISFGFKSVGVNLPKADLYIDCRSIPNPYHAAGIKNKSGASPEMRAWILQHGAEIVGSFETQIEVALRQIPSRRRELSQEEMYSKPFIIACGCAYGQHRSVAVKHLLMERLKEKGYQASVGD